MIEINFGVVTLIQRHIEALKERPSFEREMLICNCFLHLENLCAQVPDIFHVITIVVKTVNAIKHSSLKHRQFQQYL